jgi:ABC-2 type transport system ATP-binding protein
MPAVAVEDLHKSYGDLRAVDGLSLEIEQNEIFGILGPNGAGKTTTLEMIETLRDPDSGKIMVDGVDVSRNRRAVKEIIGVQLQTTVFFDNLSVYETIDLFRNFYKKALGIDYLLDLVELEGKAKSMVNDLSGGQHKRLSIALAIINDPRIVFLDEPTTGLDPQARRRIWEIIEQLRDQHKTVIVTTHYIEEAEYLCDRVAVMDHGKIIALGTPGDLIDRYVEASVINIRIDPPVDEESLKGVVGVKGVNRHDSEYHITTVEPQKTLMGVFAVAHELGSLADDVNMQRATLEDVFLKITGRRIRA